MGINTVYCLYCDEKQNKDFDLICYDLKTTHLTRHGWLEAANAMTVISLV
jgi:hypothetical protein